jgi:hypothetical protein
VTALSAASTSVDDVRALGVGVLRHVLDPTAVAEARRLVLEHRRLLRNTRPTASAGHLAGFHRYPALEPLHAMLAEHPVVSECIADLCGPGARAIGMTDITVNRSQPWHKDLLRGRFREHLGVDDPCARWHGTVFKLLAYLQPGSSLAVVDGSHRRDVDLSTDDHALPGPGDEVRNVRVEAGDVVVLDICTTHRGSEESDFANPDAEVNPKILISTVYGAAHSELATRMELGNAARLADWMRRTA